MDQRCLCEVAVLEHEAITAIADVKNISAIE
jgi:hypothetical protein